MKDRVAALAHHNETGLDSVCFVDDLFCRMTEDNIRFEFNLFLLGTLAERDETLLIALLPVFKHGMELRTLSRFRWPDYGKDEELGLHIPRH